MKNKKLLYLLLASSLVNKTLNTRTIKDGTIKWSMRGDSLTLDPHSKNEGPTFKVIRQVYETLVQRNSNMKIEAALAKSWELIDRNTWIFNLRDDVKFSNGSSMKSDDVVFSILRAQHANSGIKENINTISSVEKIDEFKIKITTSKPNPILINQLLNIFIMSKKWCKDNKIINPSNKINISLGTGPFMIESRKPNHKTIFIRNKYWWGKMIDDRVNKIELLPKKSERQRIKSLLNGNIDIDTDISTNEKYLKKIKSSSKYKFQTTFGNRVIFLGMDQKNDKLKSGNIDDNPFKKKKVRQAIYQAINIKKIKEQVMNNYSQPVGIIISPGVNGYTKDLDKRLPYDVDVAKKLLVEAGYPNGFEVELRCPNDRYIQDKAICRAIVGMLAKIKVQVNLLDQTKSKHFKDVYNNKADFYMMGWGVPTFDSHYVFDYLYETGASWNKANFSNADVDKAIVVMETEVDEQKRNAAIAKAWGIVKEDITYIPLHNQVISWASTSNINVPIRSNNEPLFKYASFN